MEFNSISFALFLSIVFAAYWMIPSNCRSSRNLLIVIASYVFYGAWDYRFLALISFTSICSYGCGLLIGSTERNMWRKAYLSLNIIVNLLILGTFKYYNFFVESFARFFDMSCDQYILHGIILPVGISFYTFQALGYSIDVYRQKILPTRDILAFLAFVSFFPQLVAGPIERATNLLPQFLGSRIFDYNEAVDGCRRMLWGFFKKLVMADNCAAYVNAICADYPNHGSGQLTIAAILFAFQIYGDFSGYSDIAIGCARLFGIRLKDNFRTPYFSRSISEFWRRWHISLNTWFVDYVYIPLGGGREGLPRKIRNTFIVFILSGIWHGANWTYLLWGLYHALLFIPGLILGNKGNKREERNTVSLTNLANMLCTFTMVTIGLIIFRAPSVGDAASYLHAMFTNWHCHAPSVPRFVFNSCIYAISFCTIVEWIQRERSHALELGRMRHYWMRMAVCYLVMLYIICNTGDNVTFIYFQF